MMVRENQKQACFRDRRVAKGSAIVLSPWHLHRHQRLWDNPDGFDPGRWHTDNGKACLWDAFLPFSSGARVCPGAGFAMIEGPLFLSRILRSFRIRCTEHEPPVPVAHLTMRANPKRSLLGRPCLRREYCGKEKAKLCAAVFVHIVLQDIVANG